MKDNRSFVNIPISSEESVVVCSSSWKSILPWYDGEEGWQVIAKYLDFKLRFGETAMPLSSLWHLAGGECAQSTDWSAAI